MARRGPVSRALKSPDPASRPDFCLLFLNLSAAADLHPSRLSLLTVSYVDHTPPSTSFLVMREPGIRTIYSCEAAVALCRSSGYVRRGVAIVSACEARR